VHNELFLQKEAMVIFLCLGYHTNSVLRELGAKRANSATVGGVYVANKRAVAEAIYAHGLYSVATKENSASATHGHGMAVGKWRGRNLAALHKTRFASHVIGLLEINHP
jgi:hypothetical protein